MLFFRNKPTAKKHPIVDIIKYYGPNDVLIWKFPNEDFNTNTVLIVDPSQEAIFVKGGQVFGRFISGTYSLNTKNNPFIRALVGLATGGVSPFSCAVYFINKFVTISIEWGTDTPISIIDPVYKVPIDIQSYGTLSLRVENGQILVDKLFGQVRDFSHQEVIQLFTKLILTQVRGVISGTMLSHGLSPIGIDAYLADMSNYATERIIPIFAPYGMAVNDFTIAAITTPDLLTIKQKAHDMREHRMETDVSVEDKGTFAQAQSLKNYELGIKEQQKNAEIARKLHNQQSELTETTPNKKAADIDTPNPITQYNHASFEQRAKNLKFLFENEMITQKQYIAKLNLLLDEPMYPLNQVEFSAVTPKKIQKGDYGLIDIYMYEPTWRYIVDEKIQHDKEQMSNNEIQEARSGLLEATGGSKVHIVLTSPNIDVIDNEETQIWHGGYLHFAFDFKLPKEYQEKQVLMIARVYIDDVVMTRLKMIISCNNNDKKADCSSIDIKKEDITSAFVSYASQDRRHVATIIQGMKKINPDLDIFFDVDNLRSGDNWEESLYREIDKRDILFLCWSHFARDSEWVNAEWHYALMQKGIDSIEPVPIEPPDVCPPPKELQQKHFNDKLLFIINSKSNLA